MRNNDAGFFFLMMLMVACLLLLNMAEEPRKYVVATTQPVQKQLTLEEKMAAAGITCPLCPNIPAEMERLRLRETVLFEGPTISLPTKQYLTHLGERCRVDWHDYGQHECLRKLEQVVIGKEDINSRVNPIYGRGEFTDRQLAYVKQGAMRTMELLGKWEQGFLETKRDRFQKEKRTSQGGTPPWLNFFIKEKPVNLFTFFTF